MIGYGGLIQAASGILQKGREEAPDDNFFHSPTWKYQVSPMLLSIGGQLLDNANTYSRLPAGSFQGVGGAAVKGMRLGQAAQLRERQLGLAEAKLKAANLPSKPMAYTVGDKTVYKQWDPVKQKLIDVPGVGGPRYKPGNTVHVSNTLGFKPLTELGKLQSDFENLNKKFGPDHPATKAAKQKIETYGLASKTKGGLEKTIVDARAGLERVKGIAKQFEPAFQTVPEQLKNKARALWEQAGGTLAPEQQQALAKFTTFQRDTIQNLNLYIRDITGAQLSEPEAARIMKGMPNLDDSPTQFKAKLDATLRELEAAIARAEGQRKGELTTPGSTSGGNTRLKFDAQGNPVQ